MIASICPEQVPGSGRPFDFTGWELLPLFDGGDGFQTPTIVNSPMVLDSGAMAIPSGGSGSLANTMNPCYPLVPPPPTPILKFPDMKLR